MPVSSVSPETERRSSRPSRYPGSSASHLQDPHTYNLSPTSCYPPADGSRRTGRRRKDCPQPGDRHRLVRVPVRCGEAQIIRTHRAFARIRRSHIDRDVIGRLTSQTHRERGRLTISSVSPETERRSSRPSRYPGSSASHLQDPHTYNLSPTSCYPPADGSRRTGRRRKDCPHPVIVTVWSAFQFVVVSPSVTVPSPVSEEAT